MMEQEQKTKKDWHKPSMEVLKAEDLKDLICAGACSDHVEECTLIRTSRVPWS